MYRPGCRLDIEESEVIAAGSYTIVARGFADGWLQLDASDRAQHGLIGQGAVSQRTSPSAQALPTSARLAISAAR